MQAVEEVVPGLASRLGHSEQEIEPLLVSQASHLTPVADEAELAQFEREWADFEPRKPASDEIVAVEEEVPSVFRAAHSMLCETAVDLLSGDDNIFGWESAMTRVRNKIEESYPGGKRLAIYNDLSEIAASFASGCICQAVAELAVFTAKERYCG
jgi:hypothetical protein